jgi:hypothetical protein
MHSTSRDQTSQDCLICRKRRTEYWMDVEKYFDTLPPHLSTCARNFRANIAGLCGDSGLLKDFLCGDLYYPVFDLPLWIFHDVRFSHSDQTPEPSSPLLENGLVQKHIFIGGFFLIAASAVINLILDDKQSVETPDFLLSHAFASVGQLSLAKTFPPHSPFWDRYRNILNEHIEFRLSAQPVDPPGGTLEAEWSIIGKRWVLAKIAPVACAMATNNTSMADPLERLIDELNNLFQIQVDLLSLKKDLAVGNVTYPILRIMRTAGIDLTQPVAPEKVFGALLLLNPIPDLLRFCLEKLAWCRSLCEHWSLSSIESLLNSWEASFGKLQELFALRPNRPAQEQRTSENHAPFLSHGDAPLPQAIQAAQSYLLSDLTFRESWEVHRWGFLGKPVLTGKVFPPGLILYLLANSGLDLGQQIDGLFDQWHHQGCNYFEEPCSLPPDTDSAGLMMRLMRFSRSKEKNARILDLSIQRILANTSDSTGIPTYLKIPVDHDQDKPYFPHIFGNTCGTVRAMVLLGLTEYGYERRQNLVRQSARQLYESIVSFGSTVNVYYTHLYWVWMTCQLYVALRSKDDFIGRSELSDKVARILNEQTEGEIRKRGLSAQEAALLILIGQSEPCASLFYPEWVERVMGRQRYNGSWEDEPFYRVPTLNHHQPGWYSSHLMTTALCYHALVTFHLKQVGAL